MVKVGSIRSQWKLFENHQCLLRSCSVIMLIGLAACGLPPTATIPPLIVLTASPVVTDQPVVSPVPETPADARETVLPVQIDQSQIKFSSSMLGLPVNGTFMLASGEVRLVQEGDQIRVYLDVVIDVTSASTGNFIIDDGMRSGLNADEYPTGSFSGVADELVSPELSGETFTVTGTMMLNNISRTVQMTLTEAVLSPASFSTMGTLSVILGDYSENAPDFIKNSPITMNAVLVAGEVSAP